MSDRDGFGPGVPCWVITMQPDPSAGAAFYGGLFGWEHTPSDDGTYLLARLRGRIVAAVTPLPPGVDPAPPPGWVTHVQVADAAETARAAKAAGGAVVFGPFDGPEGAVAVLQDPSGGVLTAWEPRGRLKGAEVVNEDGAWAMSSLQTPDPDAAAAFYGAVFGWTTETFAMGDVSATLFRLPGFVGGEPEQPVSREVVATMIEASDGAKWVVDIWVADVDAAAQRAGDLGGRVVAGPFDIPLGRTAALADPAGAIFTVSNVSGAR